MTTGFKETPIGRIPEDWEVVRLGDVLTLIRNGLTYRQNKEGNGYPITRIETISDEKIDPSKVGFVNNLKEGELKEYQLIVGDILFSHINSLEHIGKTAIYEAVPEILLHGMNLLLLRPNKEEIKPRFLLYLLKIYRLRGIFKNIAKKAVNQASINQTELKRIRIPLPPLPEQRKIARRNSKHG
ncbi:Type I restriction modification DNA specificity domain [Geoglobus ahangari]|uniref:Type I restriction modification DNA specificity domain n=1 Tax=Geoglobus ahangari TaxID=113653 RepID=A0A0F7IF35_9EURY|nr:restriction endonuclease subunit S [Geoglobus ahangari]AKG91329.1 Type I restriction modification DNA specificity domain [Geoglobus ahangari]